MSEGNKDLIDLELLKFAKEFSDNYKNYSVGEYFSDDKKYTIRYIEEIEGIKTGAKISHKTGIIEIDKSIFKREGYNSDFVFYIILWCVICKEYLDIKKADRIAIEYYSTTKRSKKNLKTGYLRLFSDVPTELNKERYELIEEMLW